MKYLLQCSKSQLALGVIINSAPTLRRVLLQYREVGINWCLCGSWKHRGQRTAKLFKDWGAWQYINLWHIRIQLSHVQERCCTVWTVQVRATFNSPSHCELIDRSDPHSKKGFGSLWRWLTSSHPIFCFTVSHLAIIILFRKHIERDSSYSQILGIITLL